MGEGLYFLCGLIETGIALLHERGATSGTSHIRIQDVLERVRTPRHV